jgi:hypothetical protein
VWRFIHRRPSSPLGLPRQVPTKNVIELAQPFFLELTHTGILVRRGSAGARSVTRR